jgi:hypothetical protein
VQAPSRNPERLMQRSITFPGHETQ